MKSAVIAVLSFTPAVVPGIVRAQDPAASYPSKPVRLFGQGVGSTADYLARFLSQRLSERWG